MVYAQHSPHRAFSAGTVDESGEGGRVTAPVTNLILEMEAPINEARCLSRALVLLTETKGTDEEVIAYLSSQLCSVVAGISEQWNGMLEVARA